MSERRGFLVLDRISAQIEQLRWLLDKAGVTEKAWKLTVVIARESDGPMISVKLERRTNVTVQLSSVEAPDLHDGRHYWIEGNHWGGKYAPDVLKEALSEQLGDRDVDEPEDAEPMQDERTGET